jgi:WD40 repeat protein
VSAAADCEVRLWDAATGEARGIASGHTANVLSCAFSPDGRRIVSGDQHNTAIVWATSTIPGSGRARKHTEMRGGNFSDDGTELAVASSGCVELWSARSGETRRTLVGDNGDLYYDCCYSPDGSRLAAASDNGFLLVWDLKTGDRILRMRTSEERMGGLESCCYSPDGRWLASAAPFRLTVLNAKTHRVARVITYVRGIFWCAFSVDSNRILDSQLQAWDIATGEQISRVAPEKSHPLEYSPDQARVLIAKDKKVHVVDSTTGRTLLVIGGQEMGRARYTPDARWITAEAAPDDLVVYNADSAKEVARFAVDGSLWRFATSNTHLACGTRGTTYLLEMCNLSRPAEATAQPTSALSRFFDVFRSKTKPGPRDLVL